MQLHHLRCRFSQFRANLKLRALIGAIGAILVFFLSGCTSDWTSKNGWVSQISSTPIELSISQTEPITNGSYRVLGTTSLPDQTELTVSAVRYFQSGASANSSYAILDRKTVAVAQGQWETRLNLWQSVNGQFQEAWQNRFISTPPKPTVTFLATLEPANQPGDLEEQVEALSPSVQAQLTGFTTDGELYLQASKTIDLAPPQTQPVTFGLSPIKLRQAQVISPNSDAAEANRQRSIDTSLPNTQFFQ